MFLIQVDGNEVEGNRCPTLKDEKKIQQAVAIFASGNANHHSIAGFNQALVSDCWADLTLVVGLLLIGGFVMFGEDATLACEGRHAAVFYKFVRSAVEFQTATSAAHVDADHRPEAA